MHTFQFTLQNAQRKYDGKIMPMDRISVQLKRLTWVQCFTGYLNDGVLFQAWPGTIDYTANCTLKIPQFWYWDPTDSASGIMITNALTGNGGAELASGNAGTNAGDNGLSKVIVEALAQVTNWDRSKIHIGQVPSDWFSFAKTVENEIVADSDMSALMGSTATVAGSSIAGGIVIPAGTYAGIALNPQQAVWASAIYNTVRVTMGLDSAYAAMAFMCAWVESSFQMYANANNALSLTLPHDTVGHDHGSVGLFQQQVGGATNSTANWGTTQQLMDAPTSVQLFEKKLINVAGGQGGKVTPGASIPQSSYGKLIQSVQGSVNGDGVAYQKLAKFGLALAALGDGLATGGSKVTGTSSSGSTLTNPIGVAASPTAGAWVGGQLASVAGALITANPDIQYHEGGDDGDTTSSPTRLDCSSLMDWVYFHTTGQHLWKSGGRSTVATIKPQCKGMPLALAWQVQGAALFVGTSHVGISMGQKNAKGEWTYTAANTDNPNMVGTYGQSTNSFNSAGFLPGIDYSGSGVTQAAADQLKTILGVATTVAPSLTTFGTDPVTGASSESSAFASLINNLIANTVTPSGGDALLPSRQLMTNQPFLPWLNNVVNASMRSYCSAPNGDFIAWFPDYFGIWGTAAVMNVELIELQDFTVRWSDQLMVTHQYVLGSPGATAFDFASGSLLAAVTQVNLAAQTQGIATMDFPEIFQAIYGAPASPAWTEAFVKRFGARPDVQSIPAIVDGASNEGSAEFFMALYLFMQRWSNMFTATVPLTFMPELWPGMLLRIPDFGFQAYVQGVTHSGTYGSNGSFTTEVQICAASNIAGSSRDDLLGLLPDGGDPLTSAEGVLSQALNAVTSAVQGLF